jgi:hypothetical protein
MSGSLSPVFQVFEQQFAEAKSLFLELGKQIKSKKAIPLSAKMSFLEIYTDLLAKIHYTKEGLNFDIFSDFKQLKKKLHKVHHLKLVEKSLQDQELKSELTYGGYREFLAYQKKQLYIQTFDMVVGSTLKTWEDFYQKCEKSSRGIRPLMVNTAINQIIQEELEYLGLDSKGAMDSTVLRDVFEGLRKIIIYENLLIHLGFNPIFVSSIHTEIEQLKDNLKPWYSNHIALQSLTSYLAEQQDVSKKYLKWAKDLKEEKQLLSIQAERQTKILFNKILV